MSTPHQEFHLNLLKASFNRLLKAPPFNTQELVPDDLDFLEQLVNLVKALEADQEDALYLGQDALCRLVRAYPHLVQLVDRDLFWFFGGDCLHFMPDEEIAVFQRLDELRFEAEAAGEPFNLEEARARLFQMH
ncbi:PA2817 family protein [Motiliproteus sp. SC1-56]|uniref:PA2817 family protein n=1 Tax=Motiliproteus sp. SC1-56 TaxID=2799565 RepID=UPI001A8ECF14|nr:PA2817 family protein [Motiliproteus sp. SC1-56]